MQKIYRILRDNKEKGPYSLEELIDLSLKPFDLIWVDGRSACWRYPTEIAALKPYVVQKETTAEKESKVLNESSVSTIIKTNTTAIQPIQMIAGENEPLIEPEEEPIDAKKLEQKAEEIYQRIQAYTEQHQKEKEGTQIKYARSLEDLKQEYADWLHKKTVKKTFNLPVKYIALAGSILLVSAAGIFYIMTGKKNTQNDESSSSNHYLTNAVYTLPAESSPQKHYPTAIYTKEREVVSSAIVTRKANKPGKENNKEQSIDEYLDSIDRILEKQNHISKSLHKTISRISSPIPAPINQSASSTTVKNNTVRSNLPLSQQITMNARYTYGLDQKSISGLEVTIQNNSNVLLKMVAVEVFYYKRGEKLFDRKTLYFNNIQPGNSFTLSTPGNKKAISARFQLGEVIGNQ